MLNVHEIFVSIQGEGYDTGLPTIFVRLYGCNLKCAYCDQPQTKHDKRRMSPENLSNKVKSFRGIKNVCITGGEPLIQPEVYALIYDLVGCGFKVSIETNGSVPIDDDLYVRSFKYVMDIKCPSSRMDFNNKYFNLLNLKSNDEVKFVIADREDYEFAKEVLRKYPTKAKILFSPMFDYEKKHSIGKDLCQWVIADLLDVKIQVQIHKILGVI